MFKIFAILYTSTQINNMKPWLHIDSHIPTVIDSSKYGYKITQLNAFQSNKELELWF